MTQVKTYVPLKSLTPVLDSNGKQLFSKDGEQLFYWQGEIHAAADNTPTWSDYGQEWDMLIWLSEYNQYWSIGLNVNQDYRPYCEVVVFGTKERAVEILADLADNEYFRGDNNIPLRSKERIEEIISMNDIWNQVDILK